MNSVYLDKSPNLINSSVDLFSPAPTDISYSHGDYHAIFPTFSVRDDPLAPTEFHVQGNQNSYLDLSSSFIYHRVKITNTDGTNLAPDKLISPCNLFGDALYESCEVYLQGVLCSKSSSHYGYKAYIQKILPSGHGAKETFLSEVIFAKDTTQDTFDSTNKGFMQRLKFSKESASFEVILRPSEAIFNQHRFVLPSTDLQLRLRRGQPQFCLDGQLDANVTTFPYKIVVEEAIFYCKKVDVSPEIAALHQSKLSKGGRALYPVRFSDVRSFHIPAGSQSIISESIFTNSVPEIIIISLVDAEAYNATVKKSPFNFQNFNCSSIDVVVDEVPAFFRNVTFDFAANQYLLGYHTLATIANNYDAGNGIRREDYAAGYFFLVFQLASSNAGNRFHLERRGQIKIVVKFSKKLDKAVNCIAYAQNQGMISIDAERNVFVDSTL